ncbi:sulfite reductase subunit alpha [Coraliomargarita akajimensis]|uniref:assimilatory sulfite reductase (NADPH) n=1 Tax=Coraliomargarita akajimensis (strain DSM 45221 / IAM 15411 / JCM 23193 / KCTC 12865 / 04OKA010-24) TaxID=583355 RepID=D5EMG8_CORAD|nr:sulfite reductase subunit alpha [Coraliomargarita akajimensis]ADE53374.1 FAD-binding domain protein [Coraliomargarita akajimensis DSM 45221]
MSTVPYIPDNAPFSEDQRAWLNGFLAGLYSEAPGGVATASAPAVPVTILYGSQTGTSEALSKQAAKQMKAANCEPKVLDMGDVSLDELAALENVLIITSTYGEGEAPDNAMSLHEALMADSAPSMAGVKYSVLGLGDSSYPDFCQCSKDFDSRLEALGAQRVAATVEVDGDPDDLFPQWIESVQGAFGDASAAPAVVEATEAVESGYTKKNPYAAKLLKSANLNQEGSSKATHHVEISLAGSGLDYEVGDALGVYPENNPALVAEIIEAAGFTADELAPLPDGSSAPIAEALAYSYDISTLTDAFLSAAARLSKHADLQALLADDEARKAYLSGRSVIDPIVDFEVKFPTPDYFVSTLKALQPRLYSISSSPKAHPGEVHLTVGKVSYESHGRAREGVCSNYLARHDGERAVKVYLHSNSAFRLPENDAAPVIMIGPGTGIAPFRAYLEEREARGAKGKNWLFFGDQHVASDFLYEAQVTDWLRSGHLAKLDTAFSRDQAEKIYVQDRMIQQAEELYAWLEEGGCVYVCGDASRMAKDVDAALHTVVEQAGGKSAEEAKAYVDAMKKAKRYLRDVY